jgi:hypothetical protein
MTDVEEVQRGPKLYWDQRRPIQVAVHAAVYRQALSNSVDQAGDLKPCAFGTISIYCREIS